MKLNHFFKISLNVVALVICIASCSDDQVVIKSKDIKTSLRTRGIELQDSTMRLSFNSEDDLKYAIENGFDFGNISLLTDLAPDGEVPIQPEFVSLLTPLPGQEGQEEPTTYYEALGYDSLVPNMEFAKLLNIKGEVEVGSEIIRITPQGTYKFNAEYEDEFNDLMANGNELLGIPVDSICSKINDHIVRYRTFEQDSDVYSLESLGDETLYPDSLFGDDEEEEELALTLSTRSANEPNYNSFPTFAADRKTRVGKFIQSIIGATKTHSVNFSKNRRVRGSFYFYNYGIYSEIGVKGWTDKKNWIGWSKKTCDELRVGWNHVILKATYPDYFKSTMQNIRSMAYIPPQPTLINNKTYNAATIIIPFIDVELNEKIVAEGAKGVFDYIKKNYDKKHPLSQMDKIEAFLVATRTEVLFVTAAESVIKYNSKYYCHVFDKQWMDFTIGWSNKGGVFFQTPSLNPNTIAEIGSWADAAITTFNQKRNKLDSGEVYICARFGDVWKGMKIIKKQM